MGTNLFLHIVVIIAACVCTGCASTFFRPLDAKSLTKAQIRSSTETGNGTGVTFYLTDPPNQETVYLISQSFPESYVIVNNPASWICMIYYDSDTRGMLGSLDNDETVDDILRQKKMELDQYLVFHSSKLISTGSLPEQLISEPCIRLTWNQLDKTEYSQLEKQFDDSHKIYWYFATASMLDITGLLWLPLKELESSPQKIHIESKNTDTIILPSISGASYYHCGGLWGIAACPFTDVGGNFVVGPGFGSSTFSNTIEQTFQMLNKQIKQDNAAEVKKNKVFEDIFNKNGYLVIRRNPSIKTICLIKKKNSPELYFWKRTDLSKNIFFELLTEDNERVLWKSLKPGEIP